MELILIESYFLKDMVIIVKILVERNLEKYLVLSEKFRKIF